jgi:hypothetical protein
MRKTTATTANLRRRNLLSFNLGPRTPGGRDAVARPYLVAAGHYERLRLNFEQRRLTALRERWRIG